MTRRDRCHLVGKRAGMLKRREAANAWYAAARAIEDMGVMDLPKFRHLLAAIRNATITAKTR